MKISVIGLGYVGSVAAAGLSAAGHDVLGIDIDREKVKAYASGLDYPLSDEELRVYYERMAAKGVQGGKLKIGLDLETDMRRISIMRDALAHRARATPRCAEGLVGDCSLRIRSTRVGSNSPD